MRPFSLIMIWIGIAACQQAPSKAPVQATAAARSAAAAATNAAKAPNGTSAATASAGAKLARIAFLDQETACDCTRKRIDASWAALQKALGTPAALTIERIHIDTEAAKAEAYTMLKPLMVTPGIYFLDAGEAVVEMLQGEVTAEQIAAVLKGN